MKPVVVAKILQEVLHASWNISSAHWLHHMMNVKKSNFLKFLNKGNIFCDRTYAVNIKDAWRFEHHLAMC